jgi:flagellar hook protein FlgE
MSIYGAMVSSITGLNANSQALGMISDNLSNVNTIGYKATHARFATLVTEITPTRYAPGGVRSSPFTAVERQGVLQATSSVTDLAVSGNGMFVVRNAPTATAGSEILYTRAGSFTKDADGNLVNAAGLYLQGWPIDPVTGLPTGNNLSQLETVTVGNLSISALPTANLDVSANLDANTAIGGTYNIDTTIVDALGASHVLRLTFTKTAANAWTVSSSAPNADLTTSIAAGAITFSPTTGALATPAGGVLTITTGAYTNGAGGPASVNLNIGATTSSSGLTQYAGFNAINSVNSDGVPTGTLSGIAVSDTGRVIALFDNGMTRDIYQLALATWPNVNGLDPRDGNAYATSALSGDPVVNIPLSGGTGNIVSSALEASTSDIAEEFTNMIITQRAYSANTRVITTADEMLEETIRIKR